MKSMLFKVTPNHVKYSDNPRFNIDDLPRKNFPYLWYLKIPILPAFSVEYFSIEHRGDLVFSVTKDDVNADVLIVETDTPTFHDFEEISVVVHYNGIRNYSLLFPWIEKDGLKRDLGLFYEEAEKNFDQGAWLSFTLMCGAVFEGMLYDKLGYPSKNNFNNMINVAEDTNIINEHQKNIINKARELRNRVHCNKFDLDYVSRTDAMDMKSLLDRLLKDFSL
ncbi:DUF4145 domain-containing protein [Bacillus mycoides]|uniref:DUF4145 domain-containing protein n=1 Tax=Bacillus mycoides TaxID=1405 RepID=UPI000278F447|nr:DUF4145 domain-containing protein [Bacillus mycoides]EJQ55127.1 hypothetical protein IEW_05563 [Bacillus mycoides]EJQ57739.1 hypothetical protein IEY_05556 [Bacillus mycoides]EJV59630.1 hypothetical protein IEU_05557 [Bacillus mycoides]